MNDLGEALAQALRTGADAVVTDLVTSESVVASASAIVVGRRRQDRRRLGAGAVAVVILAVSVWASIPAPVPRTVAEGEVGQIDPVVPWMWVPWCSAGSGSDLFPAWAQPGVTVADESVRDSGIEVEASFIGRRPTSHDFTAIPTSSTITVTAESDVYGSGLAWQGLAEVGVAFEVSWEGQARYTADAVGIVTAGERMVTVPSMVSGTSGMWRASFADQSYPRYDPETGRTTVTVSTTMNPWCEGHRMGQGGDRIPAEGDLRVRTMVQIKDESGDTLATLVDVAGVEDTVVDFARLRDIGRTYDLEPVTDQERRDSADLWDGWSVREPSSRALLAGRLAAEGVPLADAGIGLAEGMSCADILRRVDEPAAVPVLPSDTSTPRLAARASIETVDGRGLPLRVSGDVDESYLWASMVMMLMFVDDSGAVAHTAFTAPTDQSIVVAAAEPQRILRLPLAEDGPCEESGELTPGEYQVFAVLPVVPWDVEPVGFPWHAGVFGALHAWVDLGTITLMP